MAVSYFDELRIVSNPVNSGTIGTPHRIEALDNNGQRYNLALRELLPESLMVESISDRSTYQIPFEAFSQAQMTRILQIFNSIENNNMFYSNYTPEENSSIDTLIDVIQNDLNSYNWGEIPQIHEFSQAPTPAPAPTPVPDLNEFLQPVKRVLSVYDFKIICGVRNPKGKQIFRKWGPPVMEDMGITEATCSICLGDIEKWEKVAITPCKHVFHKKCAQKWFCKECVHPTCPTCRHDVTE